MLEQNQKEKMKKNRLTLYETKIFELEMDLAAAEAVGDERTASECETNIEKLRKAAAAVENM